MRRSAGKDEANSNGKSTGIAGIDGGTLKHSELAYGPPVSSAWTDTFSSHSHEILKLNTGAIRKAMKAKDLPLIAAALIRNIAGIMQPIM
jgi:hypothetical protein